MNLPSIAAGERSQMSLNGQWTFAIDPHDSGQEQGWYSRDFNVAIQIPGSWEEQGFVEIPASQPLTTWTKKHHYEGAGGYTRLIDIPAGWQDKTIELVLKGVRWSSQVWLDGQFIGEQSSLSTPHRYSLTDVFQPGTPCRLTIRVDNRMRLPLAESHINSDQTATRWGGITGGIELVATPKTAIHSIFCRPNVAEKQFHFDVPVSYPAENLHITAAITNPETGQTVTREAPVMAGRALLTVSPGENTRLWWDDDPFLYQAIFTLRQSDTILDTVEKRIGLREIAVQGKHILLNGKPVFLRGYVDCCIFPLTGYPSWDVEHYRRQFQIAKSYGFNHVRLHSWTAPEPFFQVADEAGMLVQTELPNWTAFYGSRDVEPPEAVHQFLMSELENIIPALHLHPSWVMFSNGNELIYGGDGHLRLLELVARGKELDSTRLYTDQTGFGQMPAPARPVDFYIQSCNWHPPKKIYDAASNNTTEDFSAVTAASDRPVIGHEHGQFTMYVRPSEAEKYTGVVQPAWLEAVQATFEAKSITDRVDDFIQASGIHIVRTYKENIERARRTRGLSGIQLLDIRDFPGQGHATTGILDMFWDSKGLVEPHIFAQSNSAVVLLMRAASPTFWNGQYANVDIEISNFGREATDAGMLRWGLFDRSGDIHLRGEIPVPAAESGQVTPLARLNIALPDDGRAHGWTLTVKLDSTENSWHLWSFPYPGVPENPDTIISRVQVLKNALPGANFADNFDGTPLNMGNTERALSQLYQLAIAERLSSRLLQYLYDGGSVWLMPGQREIYDFVRTRYLPPFWSYLHFPDNVSSVMGMIVHEHPALKSFPHDGFSDWQWYSLVNDTPAICLDSVPFIAPMVEVVDNFNRAKRLCYAFEAQVGRGCLFVSTWRLTDPAVAGRPEARFLLSEIVRYLRGEAFAPAVRLSVGQLLSLFRLTNGMAGDFLE